MHLMVLKSAVRVNAPKQLLPLEFRDVRMPSRVVVLETQQSITISRNLLERNGVIIVV